MGISHSCPAQVERRLRELDAKNPETPAYKDYQKRKTRIEYAQLTSDPARPRRLPHERADRAKARRADKVAAARADYWFAAAAAHRFNINNPSIINLKSVRRRGQLIQSKSCALDAGCGIG